MKIKKPKNEEHAYIVKSLEELIKPELLKDNWAREYKLFKQLLVIYPDRKIWANVAFRCNSLAFFKTKDGKELIQKIKNSLSYTMKETEKIELSKEKIGEDYQGEKILNLKEFLDKYYENIYEGGKL